MSIQDQPNSIITVNLSISDITEGMLRDSKFISIFSNSNEFVSRVEEIAKMTEIDVSEEVSDYIRDNADSFGEALRDTIDECITNQEDELIRSIKRDLESELDVEDDVQSAVARLANQYSAGSTCDTAKTIGEAIIDTIRYDIIMSMREDQGAKSVYDTSISDSLEILINKKVRLAIQQEKDLYLAGKEEYLKPGNTTWYQVLKFVQELPIDEYTKTFVMNVLTTTEKTYNPPQQ